MVYICMMQWKGHEDQGGGAPVTGFQLHYWIIVATGGQSNSPTSWQTHTHPGDMDVCVQTPV